MLRTAYAGMRYAVAGVVAAIAVGFDAASVALVFAMVGVGLFHVGAVIGTFVATAVATGDWLSLAAALAWLIVVRWQLVGRWS